MEPVSEDIAAQRPPSYRTHDIAENLPTYESKPDGGQSDQEKEHAEEHIETSFQTYLDASEVESLVGLDDKTIREAQTQLETIQKQDRLWAFISMSGFLVLFVALIVIIGVADARDGHSKDQGCPKSISNPFWTFYYAPVVLWTASWFGCSAFMFLTWQNQDRQWEEAAKICAFEQWRKRKEQQQKEQAMRWTHTWFSKQLNLHIWWVWFGLMPLWVFYSGSLDYKCA